MPPQQTRRQQTQLVEEISRARGPSVTAENELTNSRSSKLNSSTRVSKRNRVPTEPHRFSSTPIIGSREAIVGKVRNIRSLGNIIRKSTTAAGIINIMAASS